MVKNSTSPGNPLRRILLQRIAFGFAVLLPRAVFAGDESSAGAKALESIAHGREISSSGIKLTTPAIAENGNTVPISVEVEGTFTEQNYVKELHLLALDNPQPEVATFKFSPSSGKAKISTRIRLAKTQRVVAIAEWSDGRLLQAANEVKVTIGGCGG